MNPFHRQKLKDFLARLAESNLGDWLWPKSSSVLVIAAMRKFAEVFDQAGGIGLFVDAKDHAAKEYYEQFGFVPLPPDELQLFLPLQTIRVVVEN